MKHFSFFYTNFYTSCAMIKIDNISESKILIVQTQKIFWPFDSDIINYETGNSKRRLSCTF